MEMILSIGPMNQECHMTSLIWGSIAHTNANNICEPHVVTILNQTPMIVLCTACTRLWMDIKMTRVIIQSYNVLMSTSLGRAPSQYNWDGQYAQVHYKTYNFVHSSTHLPQCEDRYNCNSLLWQFKIVWNVDVSMWANPTTHIYTRSTH